MNMKVLIGDTGLVGKNLLESIDFDLTFNSRNIEKFSSYDLDGSDLYLSCLPATKWQVNQNLRQDFINLSKIFEIVSAHRYSRIVLISTIDVYSDSPLGVTETFSPIIKALGYGANRYLFELAINRLTANKIQIFRLPALFGNHLKKNVIFDLLNLNNVNQINYHSKFQWYNLARLVQDIQLHSDTDGVVNLFTEPIDTSQLLEIFNVMPSQVDTTRNKIVYDWKTIHTTTGYTQSSDQVLFEIIQFINAYQR